MNDIGHEVPPRKAMIDRIPGDDAARAIVIAVRDMAAALKLEVAVEGIEHQAQADALDPLGFRHVQGCFYAHPGPAEAFAARLRSARLATPSPFLANGAVRYAR